MARRIIAVGLVLLGVLLVINLVVPTEVLEAQRRATATPLPTYYVVADANGRECAKLNCDVVEVFAAGEAVEITGTVTGDTVRNSKSWHKVKMGRETVYIHSSLLTDKKPAPRPTQRPGSGGSSSGGSAATAVPGATEAPVSTVPSAPVTTCTNLSATCTQMSCEQAYACLAAGNGRLDADSDGKPCETQCGG